MRSITITGLRGLLEICEHEGELLKHVENVRNELVGDFNATVAEMTALERPPSKRKLAAYNAKLAELNAAIDACSTVLLKREKQARVLTGIAEREMDRVRREMGGAGRC